MNSIHSLKRAKERFGLNEVQAVRFTERALERGRTYEDMTGPEAKYMIKKNAVTGCNTVFYNGAFFLFGLNNICITMYKAPDWFNKKRYFDGKKQIHNVKKYQRYTMPEFA